MPNINLSKKRKQASGSSQIKKKAKVRHENTSSLPWKAVSRPLESGIDGDDGILELEEVEGVEVFYEKGEGGRVARFNLIQGEDDVHMQDIKDGEDETGSDSEADIEEITEIKRVQFDSESLLPNWHKFSLHSQLNGALHHKQFLSPTPIQAQAIPLALQGRDVVGVAQTGSGKTLAYGLPILHNLLSEATSTPLPLHIRKNTKRPLRALILAPTRELALQVSSHLNMCLSSFDEAVKEEEETEAPLKKKAPPLVSVAAIVGGMSAQKQRRILDRGIDVLVATPGRLWDIIQDDDSLAHAIRHDLQFLVLDEADRMIEAGHFKELDGILRLTLREESDELIPDDSSSKEGEGEEDDNTKPHDRPLQTSVFSATLSKELQRNVKKRSRPKNQGKKKNSQPATTLDDLVLRLDFRDPTGGPEVIDLSPDDGVVDTLTESKVECLVTDKDMYLYYFLLCYPGRTLVFLSAIDGIRRLLPLLEMLGQKVFPIHSQLEMRQRLKNLDRFKSSPNCVLLATDIAARGLDIQGVDHVVHYQIPRSADVYVHRNGRTARAGGKGFSLLLVAPEERRVLAGVLSSFASGRDPKSIPLFPIPDTTLLDKLKARIRLAKEIEGMSHKTRKANHEEKWMKEAAEALGVDLSDDDEANGQSFRSRKPPKTKLKQDAKLASMKAELKRLLSQPLLARGASMRYITSGSNPLVEELLQREQDILVKEATQSKSLVHSIFSGNGLTEVFTDSTATPVLLGLGSGAKRDAGEDVVNAAKKKKKDKKNVKTKSHKKEEEEWKGITPEV
ncbi:atp-dependent rna helicase mak5 [Moniliophthora roreri MCA 2997]|uniref:RNA helicase n=1 Tax=Moniliophthora roreri (strain MCA 2997) TaxID=1381753 RepID=V2XHH8_MONRO|nr:atp-dependent rna helicase mak5 [Moniliophthora roreri MCA 2997]